LIEPNGIEEQYDDPREVFGSTLVDLGKDNENIVFISCDSSLGAGAGPFNKAFPNRHFEFGIQEQNAIGGAAGMSVLGKIPFIAAYVPFVTLRCFEQIRDDLCKTKLNVNIIGTNSGLAVGIAGPTHTVLEDIGALRTLPNITIIAPSDGPEYRKAIIAASNIEGPVYMRLGRQKIRRINKEDYEFKIGKGNILRKGNDITVIATSTMVSRALDAADILHDRQIELEVINIHTLKPIDREIILESSIKTKKVITVEEHSIINGLGSAVADILIEENPVKMKMIGINDLFTVIGEYDELLDYYGLTAPKIAVKIQDFLNKF